MFGADPWGYGGYERFHMVVWIVLAIAVAAGLIWRQRSKPSDTHPQRTTGTERKQD
jgi:hypothetical protein